VLGERGENTTKNLVGSELELSPCAMKTTVSVRWTFEKGNDKRNSDSDSDDGLQYSKPEREKSTGKWMAWSNCTPTPPGKASKLPRQGTRLNSVLALLGITRRFSSFDVRTRAARDGLPTEYLFHIEHLHNT
jgi:hypothetical protein